MIDERIINDQNSPYIIAELSANHGGDLDRQKSYSGRIGGEDTNIYPDTMTIDSNLSDFVVNKGLWAKHYMNCMLKHILPLNGTKIYLIMQKIGVNTPFDESAVDLLESLNTPAYKIASFEIIDIPLIEDVAKNKPIFISTVWPQKMKKML